MNQAKQPEALRLADELVEPIDGFEEPTQLEAAASAELRRLHARVQELEKVTEAAKRGFSAITKRHDDWKWRALEAEARKPLTDEQISSIGSDVHEYLEANEGEWGHVFARAVEHAHGIGDQVGHLHEAILSLRSPECWCETCDTDANHGLRSRMSLCPQCGNKRCPRATHHDNSCTGSNEVGQKGSSWENIKPACEDLERDHSDEDAAIAAGKVQAAVQGRVG